MDNFNSKPMTYKRLWQVLEFLGFERIDRPEYLLFTKESCDALVALPHREPDGVIHFWHEAAARSAVAMRGIASVERFYELLGEPAQPHAASGNSGTEAAETSAKGAVRVRKADVAGFRERKSKVHRIVLASMEPAAQTSE